MCVQAGRFPFLHLRRHAGTVISSHSKRAKAGSRWPSRSTSGTTWRAEWTARGRLPAVDGGEAGAVATGGSMGGGDGGEETRPALHPQAGATAAVARRKGEISPDRDMRGRL